MRMIAKLEKSERKRKDSSVRRAAKCGRMTKMTRIRGPIWTHPSGLTKTARRLPHVTLDRQAKSGNLAAIRQFAWGMSDQASENSGLVGGCGLASPLTGQNPEEYVYQKLISIRLNRAHQPTAWSKMTPSRLAGDCASTQDINGVAFNDNAQDFWNRDCGCGIVGCWFRAGGSGLRERRHGEFFRDYPYGVDYRGRS